MIPPREDAVLSALAPGVLGNDTDTEGDTVPGLTPPLAPPQMDFPDLPDFGDIASGALGGDGQRRGHV